MSQFCYPVLPLAQYVIWDGCGFLDPKYLAYEKSHHPGVDWNGRGGGDSDLGAPVYGIADGVVTHAQNHRVWGNVVVIHHPDGRAWSQYGHLHEMRVKVGQTVNMAQQIGSIGKGGTSPQYPKGRYHAHLHFEIRKEDVPADEWPSAMMVPSKAAPYIRKTRVDPVKFLDSVGALKVLPAPHPTTPLIVKPRPEAPSGAQGYLYGPARDTKMAPTGEWVSIAVDGSGTPLVDGEGHARTVVFDEALARKKGLVE